MTASFFDLHASLTSYLPRIKPKTDLTYILRSHNKNVLEWILCVFNAIVSVKYETKIRTKHSIITSKLLNF